MVENKNFDFKQADSKKSSGIDTESYQVAMKEMIGEKKEKDLLSNYLSRKKNRNLPIIADIAIGILIILIAVALVWGSYSLFRYYADDYGEQSIEYVFLANCEEDESVYRIMKNRDMFMDTEDNSYYFGKVTNVEFVENEENDKTVVFTVSVKAKYKRGSGYVVGDERIAVGSEYTLRMDSLLVDGTIVELKDRSN